MPAPPVNTTAPEGFRGVNNRLSPETVPAEFAYDALNYRMRTTDCVPRQGMIKPGWLNRTSALVEDVKAP